MLLKMKGMLLGFVKPLVLAHLKDMSMLSPMLSKVLIDKSHMDQATADALSMDLIAVIEKELEVLINKI